MQKNFKFLVLILVIVICKLPLFLMNHIQEDAFITWRVAQNFIEHGVIGFNGAEKASASTTHFYVFVSIIFNYLFGKENFIYPILIFNTFLFTTASVLIGKILFTDFKKITFFVIAIGILPPALKIGYLGMEYAIVIFLDSLLLYFGFFKKQNWSYFLIPILLLWTRLDTAIFLGILFLFDVFYYKKWNFYMMLGGIIGISTVFLFNYFYFGEWVNQTIVAKKYAYFADYTFTQKLYEGFHRLDHFWGMIKIPEKYPNLITYFIFILEFLSILYISFKEKGFKRVLFIFLFVFAHIKMTIFISQLSFFDWYFWIPQILAFISILYLLLEVKNPMKNFGIYLLIFGIPLFCYQLIHSIATGNGEWNYRREIGIYMDKIEPDKSQQIFLEPAGYIPYFSGLRTIDQVGLVERKHLNQIIKDAKCADFNTFAEQKPKYILYLEKFEDAKNKDCNQFNSIKNYELIKKFDAQKILKSDNSILEFIYKLKPSARDYYLYRLKK
jgi:hypothetical protein